MKIPVNTDRVTILSVCFLCLFISFNSAQNYSGQAMKDDGFDNLGFQSLATLYLFFSFFSFFSSAIVNALSVKTSLILGAFCYFFWVFCFLAPAFYKDNKNSDIFILNSTFIQVLVLISAAVNGFGAAILWVA